MSNTIVKILRPGAGKTKGATSFVHATLEQLVAANPNAKFKWRISRKQLEMLGVTISEESIPETQQPIVGQVVESVEEEKVQINTIEF